jgi:hypothetical protein
MRFSFFVATLATALAASAHAATLWTPPAKASFANETLVCLIGNASNNTRTVSVHTTDYAGTILESITHEIAPREWTVLAGLQGDPSSCRFDVSASAKNFRAGAAYVNEEETTIFVVAE